ncbi:hypothetical protein BD777DRAFT_125389 [Yarrowia lipolytica]|jgi:hypothetical protein|nr:hypothetical protein BD777DRAFT_125389 [Yarrowia lipolytica]
MPRQNALLWVHYKTGCDSQTLVDQLNTYTHLHDINFTIFRLVNPTAQKLTQQDYSFHRVFPALQLARY